MALTSIPTKALEESGRLLYNRNERDGRTRAIGETIMASDDSYDLLRHTPLFAGLSDSELARMASDLHRRCYAGGETIFHQGDPGNAVYVVASGRVRIYVPTEEGQEVSVVFYGPGGMFGEMALVDQKPRSATAQAMEDTVVWAMNGTHFYRHLRENYQVALNLMQLLSRRLRATTDHVRAMASLDVSRRTIQALLDLAHQQGRATPEGIRLGRLTQQDLASLIGTSRESVNRALRALARKGLVAVLQGQIVVCRPEELTELLGEESS